MKEINQNDLPELLSPLGGGFYSGLLHMGHDPQVFALVVAPKAEGEFDDVEWGEYGKKIEGADSFFDGLANTEAMAAAGLELAQKIRALRIGGMNDWHLGARDQVELMYRHCKPTSEKNWEHRHGDNPSSVPVGYPYTEQLPAQCTNALFQAGGAEAFADEWYWSSTQCSANLAWGQYFVYGLQFNSLKAYEARARAVRLIRVIH